MNEGLWVLVGVLLGFVGTYVLQRLQENRRKKKLCTVARNIIGSEIIHNLRRLERIEHLTKIVAKDKDIVSAEPLALRCDLFIRFLDLPSMSVLDRVEQGLLIEVVSQLNEVTSETDKWGKRISRVRTYDLESKEALTEELLSHVTILRRNLLELLGEICFREKEGLQSEQLKGIYHKLQIIERVRKTQAYLGKSSDYKNVKQEESERYLVVWEHDWPECPLEIIELRPSKEDNSS